MSWVSIDKDRCNECGICVTRCALVFRDNDGEITAKADENNCNLCGHCISLCPTEAIVHNQMDMDNFNEIKETVKYDIDDFIQFIRTRRSHRTFKDKEIPREDLEKLVDLCRYAPTGSNKQTVEILVIQDKEKIRKLSDFTVDFFENNLDEIEQEAQKIETEGQEVPQITKSMLNMRETLNRVVKARKFGFEVIFHQAPAVMIFHSPSLTSTPKDDCVIAAQTVVMAAMTMGLGTCYIGLFEFAANRYGPIIDELNLPSGNKVFSVLIMGYPKLKYLRTVDRMPMEARWE
ncbi:MAG: nitroreductase family protein [Pseudomonadota bacterium]